MHGTTIKLLHKSYKKREYFFKKCISCTPKGRFQYLINNKGYNSVFRGMSSSIELFRTGDNSSKTSKYDSE